MPNFPLPETILEMEPEEIAPFVLQHLKTQPENSINRYNFTSHGNHQYASHLGHGLWDKYLRKLMEGWLVLEREGFIAPKPGQQNDWMYITDKGKKIIDSEDFKAYVQVELFPKHIDSILVRTVKPLFMRGDYETAVFRAFKEVEIRVRKNAELTNDDYGVELMKKAFGPGGKLEDNNATKAERDRTRELFIGAIGIFKNPTSHREVKYTNVLEVIDMISFANLLLTIIGRKSN